jgi:hypothetical protein
MFIMLKTNLYIVFAAFNVMKGLIDFCDDYTPYHLTSMTLRSLVETATDQGFWDGAVSRAEQQSIHRISGHNATTAKLHYVKHSRSEDVRRASAAFERLFGAGAGAGASREEV